MEVKRISFWARERHKRSVVEAQVGRVVRGVGGSQPVLEGGLAFVERVRRELQYEVGRIENGR